MKYILIFLLFSITTFGQITKSSALFLKTTDTTYIENRKFGNELITNQADRDFSSASSWTNNNIDSYDETGDLTITATNAGVYCTLPIASCPTTIGKRYKLSLDVITLTTGWSIQDFIGNYIIFLSSSGANSVIFTAQSTGGLKIITISPSGEPLILDNFSLVEYTGTYLDTLRVGNFFIADSAWDDLITPATLINPSGSPSPPTIDNTDGSWLFDKSTANTIVLIFQMPHAWLQGSDIAFHIHWAKAVNGSGNVIWTSKYKWTNINEVALAFSSPVAGSTIADADSNVADNHRLTQWTRWSGVGKTFSSMLVVYLERTATSGLDDYDNNAKLISVDLHYRKDSNGTRTEYSK